MSPPPSYSTEAPRSNSSNHASSGHANEVRVPRERPLAHAASELRAAKHPQPTSANAGRDT